MTKKNNSFLKVSEPASVNLTTIFQAGKIFLDQIEGCQGSVTVSNTILWLKSLCL